MANKKREKIAIIVVIAMTLSLFSLAIRLLVGDGFSIWYFAFVDKTIQKKVDLSADTLSYNLDKDASTQEASAKEYDVYFLAQNLDINNFIEPDETVNDLNPYKFKNESDGHGLYYTNSGYAINSYEPRLGSWDENFSTDSSIPTNLYKKFENVTSLSALQIASIGEPYSKMCDYVSKSGAVWDLKFQNWTLDNVKIDYDTVYEIDPVDPGKKWNLPLINQETGEKVVKHYEIQDASIYIRANWLKTDLEGYYQVYGTYPTKDFNVAHLDSLLEFYDSYAKTINGRKSLFFYPIYSLGKDNVLSSVRNDKEKAEDCFRIEDSKISSTDRYFTFDCEYTDLIKTKPSIEDNVQYWEIPGWTDEAHRYQGWTQYVTKYKCFRFSNRVVTSAMVEKNELAKTSAVAGSSSGNYNLTALQENQITLGDYIFVDIARERKAWDGTKMGYLLDSTGDLLNINYKEGLFNIYIFTRQEFIDNAANYSSNPSRFDFTNQQIEEINQVMKQNNINIDKSVRCLPYMYHVQNTWNRNDGRGFYVVFEEIITPTNSSQYSNEQTPAKFDYFKNPTSANSFITNGAVEFNIDIIENEVSTNEAIKDLDDNTLTLTYPDYYFTNHIQGEHGKKYIQNIGRGANSPNYTTPTYKYFLQGGSSIYKEFINTEYLETIYDAVLSNQRERERIKITNQNNETYSLEQLKNDASQSTLYQSILSQLQSVYLIKVKESGLFRLCVYCYKNNNNDYEFDVWISSPKGYIVTIYDKTDFNGAEIEKDEDGVMTSREWAMNNYSFIANLSFYENGDLMHGNTTEITNYIDFKINESKAIPPELQSYIITRTNINYIRIDTMLEYLDLHGQCLYDFITGRYITFTNIQTNPFKITGDLILQLVDKPSGII